MENLPERQNPHAHLRASDEDRDRVVEVLRDSLMTGRLSQDEHAERLEQTLNARTLGDLEPITQDLAVPGPATAQSATAQSATARAASARPAVGASSGVVPIEEPANPADSTDTVIGIFGGGERKGRWRVKRRTNAVCIFGGYDLDMTDAVFEGREVVLWTFAVFGGVDITVPDEVEVRSQGVGIFGGFAVRGGDNPHPDAPVVVVKGLALFGGVGGQTSSRRHKRRSHGGSHGGH